MLYLSVMLKFVLMDMVRKEMLFVLNFKKNGIFGKKFIQTTLNLIVNLQYIFFKSLS